MPLPRVLVPLTLSLALAALAGCASLGERSDDATAAHGRAGPHDRGADGAPSHVSGPQGPYVPDALRGPTAAPDDGLWGRVRAGFRLSPVAQQRIDAELRRYAGRQRYFEAVVERAEPYIGHILARIEARDLPAELLLVPIVESAFRPFAYSYSRAGGLWQFKPATGRHFGLEMDWWYDGRRDVIASTEAALDYFEYLHGFFDGDWLLAIAAYNGGEGTVRRAVTRNRLQQKPTDFWHLDLPTQTEHYVPRVLALRRIVADPAAHGIALPEPDPARALTLVEVGAQIDLARAAEWAGLDLETLYRYNPGFNRWATAPDGPHRLALPAAGAERFRAALAEHGTDDLVRWRRHEVAGGETLSGIADAYGTTIDALRAANDIAGHLIRAGDHLLVPSASRSADAYALSARNRRQAVQADGPAGRRRIEHEVKRGDTWWAVAQTHGVDVRRLAAWNGMAPADPLHPGDTLVVWVRGQKTAAGGPRGRMQRVTYTVRRGDSLYAIARRFNLAVADIRRWNDLEAGQHLQPGQRLQLRVDVTAQAEAG